MLVQHKSEAIGKISLFQGLDVAELDQIARLCEERSFNVGEICQVEGQSMNRVNMILRGRVGAVVRIPNVTYLSSEIILDTLLEGDVFGWSCLIQDRPWSTLRVIDPTEVLSVDGIALLNLFEVNPRIGYVVMRHLAGLIASRLRRNRMSMLNAIVAIRGT